MILLQEFVIVYLSKYKGQFLTITLNKFIRREENTGEVLIKNRHW